MGLGRAALRLQPFGVSTAAARDDAGRTGNADAERLAQRVRRIKREIERLQRMRRLGVLSAMDTDPRIIELETTLAARRGSR
jgi:hypothetical protein